MNEKAPPTPAFRDVLHLGTKGTQPVAVKRGLYRAGFHEDWDGLDSEAIADEIFGAAGVTNLEAFQRYHGLPIDGVYGPASHKKLRGSFDAYARKLYTHVPPPPAAKLQLPATFRSTHATAGLPGYPAIDMMAPPGTTVGAPEAGRVDRLSGKDPAQGGTPGRSYGWSIYLTCNHARYYLTHFASRTVSVGSQVVRGQVIGTVCDARVARMSSTLSHIHEGKREW